MKAHKVLPERAPLDMPRHRVNERGQALRQNSVSFFYSLSTVFSRLFILLVTVGLSSYGIIEMHGVLSTNSITSLQWVFLFLFSLNFIWISFAFSQALLGFLINLKPRLIKKAETDPAFKTAILFPVYKEEPGRIVAAIKAMREDLLKQAPGKYAFFIIRFF